jgi:hypothetical protein
MLIARLLPEIVQEYHEAKHKQEKSHRLEWLESSRCSQSELSQIDEVRNEQITTPTCQEHV